MTLSNALRMSSSRTNTGFPQSNAIREIFLKEKMTSPVCFPCSNHWIPCGSMRSDLPLASSICAKILREVHDRVIGLVSPQALASSVVTESDAFGRWPLYRASLYTSAILPIHLSPSAYILLMASKQNPISLLLLLLLRGSVSIPDMW